MPEEAELNPISLTVEHVASDSPGEPALLLLQHFGLAEILVQNVMRLVPDTSRWRLTVTGDMAQTVDAKEGRDASDGYTIERGAGRAGAKTIRQEDGTFDIVIADAAFFETHVSLPDDAAVVQHARDAAAHIALHEAGHVVLFDRAEESEQYQELPSVEGAAWLWRKHIAVWMDENRIEQLTARMAPNPARQVDHLPSALEHLRAEYSEAQRTQQGDGYASYSRTCSAANDTFRVLSYLSAELGLDSDGRPVRPQPRPDDWDAYVEHSWDELSGAFHRLRPADESMSVDELAAVLETLCVAMITWMHRCGVDYEFDSATGPSMWWTRDSY
ncbi:hypothetical protein [Clavibacter sp. VKM Ac-2542]|uniref:hypothetical protein n=1 Tax=Clavibacter sp. VKM Ac-2542 TaxID=2783811 RepID=UPI00188B8EB9|nr:hypothetical protein [Clavibacter sp. VKM Ac-2542]MBF4621513.1 hypothetical protein [Clavibacter sp. VKM Ac-2542]